MSKPPVFYYLIQVRFNRMMQMNQYVPAFQEAMRQLGFADYNEEAQLEVVWQQAPGAQPGIQEHHKKRWLFNDMDRTSGFVLLDDALVYHTTVYHTYAQCKRALESALQQLHQIVGLNFIQRIGMRYLDCIETDTFAELGEFVHSGLLGVAGVMPGELRQGFSETVTTFDDTALVLKSLVAQGPLRLPPDLQGLSLVLPERLCPVSRFWVLMDTDCYIEKRFTFEMQPVIEQLDKLHTQLLDLFKSCITEKAKQKWQL
jgi:uncharacterized protein (TIGR04255 family)